MSEIETVVHKVGAGSDPKKVGSAIAHYLAEGKRVQVRSIGAGATHQAAKSIAIAGYYAGQHGTKIAAVIEFTEVQGREEPITAMVLTVVTL